MEEQERIVKSIKEQVSLIIDGIKKIDSLYKDIKDNLLDQVTENIKTIVLYRDDNISDLDLEKLIKDFKEKCQNIIDPSLKEDDLDSWEPDYIPENINKEFDSIDTSVGILKSVMNQITGKTGVSGLIKDIRLSRNLTQKDLAKIMNVTSAEISRIELSNDLRTSTIIKICKALNVHATLSINNQVRTLC